MSLFLILCLAWLGLGMLALLAGLTINTRMTPNRYVMMRAIEFEEAQSDDAPEQRQAA